MKLNKKGIFFTLMALLLIMGILGFNQAITRQLESGKEYYSAAKLSSVNEKFSGIKDSVLELHPTGFRQELDERILPFEYEWARDSNSINIKQLLPLKTVELENYFNFLNVFAVFVEDENYSNVFDGLKTDVNTVKNAPWGGSTEKARFLIQPFCWQYRLSGENQIFLEESKMGKCHGDFSTENIKRFDVNMVVRNFEEDFNSILCNGGESCPQENFDPASSNPFYQVTVIDKNCGYCDFSQYSVSQHFSWSEESCKGEASCEGISPASECNSTPGCSWNAESCNGIVECTLISGQSSCENLGCNWTADNNIFVLNPSPSSESEPVEIIIGETVRMRRQSNKSVRIDVKTGFKEEIEAFKLLDFNFTVYSRNLKSRKSNNPNAIN